jgi:hypothetical protein
VECGRLPGAVVLDEHRGHLRMVSAGKRAGRGVERRRGVREQAPGCDLANAVDLDSVRAPQVDGVEDLLVSGSDERWPTVEVLATDSYEVGDLGEFGTETFAVPAVPGSLECGEEPRGGAVEIVGATALGRAGGGVRGGSGGVGVHDVAPIKPAVGA